MTEDRNTDPAWLRFLKRLFVVLLVITIAVVIYRQAFHGSFPWDSHQFRSTGTSQVVTQSTTQGASTTRSETPDPSRDLAYASLNTTQRSLYALLLTGLQEHLDTIGFQASQASDVQRAYDAVIADHPELIWADETYTLSGTDDSHIVSLKPNFLFDEAEANERTAALEKHADELLGQISATDEYGRAEAIHDIEISEGATAGDDDGISMKDVFSKGSDTDAWYARCYMYLMQRDGHYCAQVVGSTRDETSTGQTAHTWNLVCIDGTYSFVDCARDDGGNGEASHALFCVGDDDLPEDYSIDTWLQVPACTTIDNSNED
jgi:hypothetical protein